MRSQLLEIGPLFGLRSVSTVWDRPRFSVADKDHQVYVVSELESEFETTVVIRSLKKITPCVLFSLGQSLHFNFPTPPRPSSISRFLTRCFWKLSPHHHFPPSSATGNHSLVLPLSLPRRRYWGTCVISVLRVQRKFVAEELMIP